MGNRQFLKGALLLSISMFATKLLGLLYVIPFQRLVGETGMALYSYAYVPYALFISLSTLGIPVGISKFISKYNSEGAYDTSRKIFRLSLVFMGFLGLIGFAALYLMAPWYARLVLGENGGQVLTVEEVTMAIRMTSYALLIIPPMAIFRGFFQGNQDMLPTSVSQFAEQFTRITVILLGSYYIIHVLDRSMYEAVSFSVFAAFIAGVASLGVLTFFWFKNKGKYDTLITQVRPHEKHSLKKVFPELISYAVPFAILGLTNNLFQIIDQATFSPLMMASGVSEQVSTATYGIYVGSLSKMIMIPVSFAIAFGQPLIPSLTEHVAKKNREGIQKALVLAIQLTCFITIPAVVGISLLSGPIFTIFVSSTLEPINAMGGQLFGLGAYLGLFMALYSILVAILQGIGKHRDGIKALGIALIIKLVGNLVLINVFQTNGAIYSTMLAYTYCIVSNLIIIKKSTGFKMKKLWRRITPIVVFTGAMAAVVLLVRLGLDQVLSYEGAPKTAVIYVSVAGSIGALIYFGLCWYFDLLKNLLGMKAPRLRKFKKA